MFYRCSVGEFINDKNAVGLATEQPVASPVCPGHNVCDCHRMTSRAAGPRSCWRMDLVGRALVKSIQDPSSRGPLESPEMPSLQMLVNVCERDC